MVKFFTTVLFAGVIFAAVLFALQPISEGYGRAIETGAEQKALNSAAARADRVRVWEATRPDRAQGVRVVVYSGAAALAALFVGLSGSAVWLAAVRAKANGAAAMVQARCIPLDPRTRQYPLVLDSPVAPRFVYNPNTGQVTRLVLTGNGHGVGNGRDRSLHNPQAMVQAIGVGNGCNRSLPVSGETGYGRG